MVPGTLVTAGAVRALARDDTVGPIIGPLRLALDLGPGLAVTLVGGGVGAWIGHSIVHDERVVDRGPLERYLDLSD